MCNHETCKQEARNLTYETLVHDPLVQLVNSSDGVTEDEFLSILELARAAVASRESDHPVTTSA